MPVVLENFHYYLAVVHYRFVTQPQRKVLVNGVPKSGTTWMYRMISTVPGYHSKGNFQRDISRYHDSQPGDVIHGHDWYTAELQEILQINRVQVVLVVRDPRDQAVSRMFHLKRDETHAWQPTFKQLSKDEALMLSIEGQEDHENLPFLPGVTAWHSFTRQWLDGGMKLICIRYEDLLAAPEEEMGQVFDRLGIAISEPLLKAVVRRNRFERLTVGRKFWQKGRDRGQEDAGSHFRKGITGDWQNHFNEDHRRRFKELAGDWLIEMGYETDMDW
jgi:hypothetical protein